MAPTTANHPIDWRLQTIDNCRFIYNGLGAFAFSVITTKDKTSGAFKAVALRAHNGHRQPLFSESAATVPEALQALHARSAEAVQDYVDANGWNFVYPPYGTRTPGIVEVNPDPDDSEVESVYSHSDASSTITLSDVSDEDLVSVGGHPSRKQSSKGKKRASRSSRKGKDRARRSRSRSPSTSRSRSPSRSRPRSRSRSPSKRSRSRSSSAGTVTSSLNGEASRITPGPPLAFRPNHLRMPACPPVPPGWGLGGRPSNALPICPPPPPPPGWGTSYRPGGPPSFPTFPATMRPHQQGPLPPPPPPPFPAISPMANPGPPPPPPQFFPPTEDQRRQTAEQHQRLLQLGAQQRARQATMMAGLQVAPAKPSSLSDSAPETQGHDGHAAVARSPGSVQSDGGDISSRPKPNAGYNPFTTVFSLPADSAPYDVLLEIHWYDNKNMNTVYRKRRFFEQVPRLSATLLKKAALKIFQQNPENKTSTTTTTTSGSGSRAGNMCVSLKQVTTHGGEICDISNYPGDDLLRLVQALDDSDDDTDMIPTFVIDIWDPARGGPPDGITPTATTTITDYSSGRCDASSPTSTSAPTYPAATRPVIVDKDSGSTGSNNNTKTQQPPQGPKATPPRPQPQPQQPPHQPGSMFQRPWYFHQQPAYHQPPQQPQHLLNKVPPPPQPQPQPPAALQPLFMVPDGYTPPAPPPAPATTTTTTTSGVVPPGTIIYRFRNTDPGPPFSPNTNTNGIHNDSDTNKIPRTLPPMPTMPPVMVVAPSHHHQAPCQLHWCTKKGAHREHAHIVSGHLVRPPPRREREIPNRPSTCYQIPQPEEHRRHRHQAQAQAGNGGSGSAGSRAGQGGEEVGITTGTPPEASEVVVVVAEDGMEEEEGVEEVEVV